MTGKAQPEHARRLVDDLRSVVGRRHVLTAPRRTARYRTGFRTGAGPALAVVRPGTLVEQWRVLMLCAGSNVIVVMQAANTGLTGGSVPDGDEYDRPIVLINTLRLDRIDLIEEGRQAVCLAGATLHDLERRLARVGRTPHSVIGSSCIGASVVGGISNNSGGSLIARGPAYTELALFARIASDGQLMLVNNIGIDLGCDPIEILGRLDRRDYQARDIQTDHRRASDLDYARRVRDIDADTPARFNADPGRLYEASGSAGKVAIFAVRVDSFAAEAEERTFYIGTNDAQTLTSLRRHILSRFDDLPVAAEYMDRAAFDLAHHYGKDSFVMIDAIGTSRMPAFFATKARIEAVLARIPFLPHDIVDRVLQAMSRLWPEVMPARMLNFRDRFTHHLMLKMAGAGIAEAQAFLSRLLGPEEADGQGGAWFTCTRREGIKAFLHRFVAAGAAIRYALLKSDGAASLVALDVALPRNARTWQETLPDALSNQCLAAIYYGHFFCHVFHQDYVLKSGVEAQSFKLDVLALQDGRDAEYPAEHNVGHLYAAKPALRAFYAELDPVNTMNAGIGKMSKFKYYGTNDPAKRASIVSLPGGDIANPDSQEACRD